MVVQLSRYERIEEEGESRSGNYEKDRRASESEEGRARASHRIAAGLWLEQRRRRHACYPISRTMQRHTQGTFSEHDGRFSAFWELPFMMFTLKKEGEGVVENQT